MLHESQTNIAILLTLNKSKQFSCIHTYRTSPRHVK